MVASVVAICCSIVLGQIASTWTLRGDVGDIKTKIAAQDELKKLETKIEDERNARTIKDVGDIKAQQTMLDLKINNLRETVLTNQQRK